MSERKTKLDAEDNKGEVDSVPTAVRGKDICRVEQLEFTARKPGKGINGWKSIKRSGEYGGFLINCPSRQDS